MSAYLPSEYFKPVFDAATKSYIPPSVTDYESLQQRAIENLRVHFLHYFDRTQDAVDLLPSVSLSPSPTSLAAAEQLIHNFNLKLRDFINDENIHLSIQNEETRHVNNTMTKYLHEEYFTVVLKPYLADMLDRGIIDDNVLLERYAEFAGFDLQAEKCAPERFWNSPAVILYSNHLALKEVAESIADADHVRKEWFPDANILQVTDKNEKIRSGLRPDL
ncbi:hypothetical protein IFU23_24280 [Pantoea agglomerans]|uniref:Uncharacterized protein n=1 Tax=Enterobacter agglomerans TaxID=549 RepID=A0ACC5PVS8_ENTAG|nr:hypothetical protein [Pantoea agglomerans]MBD8129228.1 hypothetical protein [Pantoea agglomerans]MBD8156433.1 hypothetical protein [Pantoea agglomerans]MBD8161201.1 hypothetical protein [Pantoea agglomerans]MBD8234835.1 hypothetical protein [Pantoea agglomerans]MBD8245254.1 hypothetical protein [Pantoea agglomerans]